MRIKASLWLYGIVAASIWSVSYVQSVFLTSTLITGMMGGYLIGRMPLGTFLGALTNNASLPSLPSVTSFLPSFPTFSPRQEEEKKTTETIAAKHAVTTTAAYSAPTYPSYPLYPTYPSYLYPPVFPPTVPPSPTPIINFPFPYSYSGNGLYAYNMFTSTTTPPPAPPAPSDSFGFSYIKPVDVPVSLDNKIRERFIRQLAMIDPLNCLPKTFCEVTSDPYRATMALDKGSILGMASITQPRITKEELMAYESQLLTERPPPRPSTTQATTTTSQPPQEDANEEEENNSHDNNDDDDDEENNDDDDEEPNDDNNHSGSNEEGDEADSSHSNENSGEDDDSFERYRKEQEHKLEMEALNELVDDIEDPDEYMFILRDKQRRKDARRKYMQKHSSNDDDEGLPGSPEQASFRRDALVDPEMHSGFYQHEEPSMALARRAGSEPDYYFPPPMPPLPPQPPPTPAQPSFTSFFRRSRPTTEAPIKDMFADDPFFNDDSGRSGRKLKDSKKTRRQRRNKRDLIGDPLTQYRLAYIVAEKYKNPNLCNTAFPSCPYQTQTIMSVVNRLESGVLPFGKGQVNRYREKSNRNNLDQFRNTLVAIERLNKATMNARSRGEPIDIEEMTEVASNPSSDIEAHTSQDIVNEFQKVVTKIQTAQFANRRLQLEKAKPLNSDQPRSNYDAVHYYKKAQMEDLKPKERLKTGILETKTNVRQQDDEAPYKRNVPTFKETYREMFKKAVKKSKAKSTTPAPNIKYKNHQMNQKRKSDKTKAKPKPTVQQNMSSDSSTSESEDDERDAINEEKAVDEMIMGKRRQRSRLHRKANLT